MKYIATLFVTMFVVIACSCHPGGDELDEPIDNRCSLSDPATRSDFDNRVQMCHNTHDKRSSTKVKRHSRSFDDCIEQVQAAYCSVKKE